MPDSAWSSQGPWDRRPTAAARLIDSTTRAAATMARSTSSEMAAHGSGEGPSVVRESLSPSTICVLTRASGFPDSSESRVRFHPHSHFPGYREPLRASGLVSSGTRNSRGLLGCALLCSHSCHTGRHTSDRRLCFGLVTDAGAGVTLPKVRSRVRSPFPAST